MQTRKGQILLITVMLLATIMTIVLSVSFKSATDTQVTKLEEESQKALSAAESAIEVALKNNSTARLGSGGSTELTNITGFEGTATIESSSGTTFTTLTIPKDGSYTFYLGNYNLTTKDIGASGAQDISICFDSGSALDITLVKATSLKKYVVDPGNRINNSLPATGGCSLGSSITIPASDINAGGSDGKFLFVRVVFAPSKLLFTGLSGVNLPIQGRTITSEATSSTSTGVSKKVVLFQSYPQMPGEFFNTAF